MMSAQQLSLFVLLLLITAMSMALDATTFSNSAKECVYSTQRKGVTNFTSCLTGKYSGLTKISADVTALGDNLIGQVTTFTQVIKTALGTTLNSDQAECLSIIAGVFALDAASVAKLTSVEEGLGLCFPDQAKSLAPDFTTALKPVQTAINLAIANFYQNDQAYLP